MKMIHKVRYLFIASFVVTNLALFFISQIIFQNKFEEAESLNIKNELRKVSETVDNELVFLKNTSSSWTSWDDTFQFINDKGKDKKYIETNFSFDAISLQQYDKIILIDQNKKTLFGFSYDYEKSEQNLLNQDEIEKIKNSTLKAINLNKSQSFQGLLYLDKFYLVSINPVLKSDFSGPANGYAFFMKEINANLISKIENLTGHHFEIINSSNTTAIVNNSFYEHINSEMTEGFVLKTDLTKNNTVIFKFNLKRDLSNIGKEGMFIFMLVIAFMMGILYFSIYKLTLKNIILPIIKIKNELHQIRDLKDTKKRINYQSNDELGELSQDINLSLERIENDQMNLAESSRMYGLGTLASGIAHEINNPLTVIKGYAEKNIKTIEARTIDLDDFHKNAIKINENAERISKIIKSLKILSSKANDNEFQKLTPQNIIDEFQVLYSEKLNSRKIELIFEKLENETKININLNQFLQVVIHLANNAIDAIELADDDKPRWIKFHSEVVNNYYYLYISNSGKKLSADIKDKIMNPFFTTKEIGKGTGLGLTLSQTIISKHSGKLEFDDSFENTTFKIMLPIAEKESKDKKVA